MKPIRVTGTATLKQTLEVTPKDLSNAIWDIIDNKIGEGYTVRNHEPWMWYTTTDGLIYDNDGNQVTGIENQDEIVTLVDAANLLRDGEYRRYKD